MNNPEPLKCIYWFYCYKDDPINFPELPVIFTCAPIKPFENNIYENYGKLRNKFIDLLKELQIDLIDEFEIKAKYIPKIREELNKLGCREEYIAFGP